MTLDTKTFLKVLDPADTSAGGGSASAIAGAMAGSLIAMVCRLMSKSGADEQRTRLDGTAVRAQELSTLLVEGAREDTAAFQAVRNAYRLPKDSDEERKIRNRAIQEAWSVAAQIPLDNAARCLEVARLGSSLLPSLKPGLGSDLNCALLLTQAGVLGCLENVAVNLPSIKDQDLAAQLAQKAGRLREQFSAVRMPVMRWQNTERPRGEAETQ